MHVTALDVIAPHARYKLWVKPNGEMPFLYGGNVVKAHVGKWSEDCPAHQGVVVLGMDDTPLVCWMASPTSLLPPLPSSGDGGIKGNYGGVVYVNADCRDASRDLGSRLGVRLKQGGWSRRQLRALDRRILGSIFAR